MSQSVKFHHFCCICHFHDTDDQGDQIQKLMNHKTESVDEKVHKDISAGQIHYLVCFDHSF